MAAPEKIVTAEQIDQKPAEVTEQPAAGAVTRKGAPPPEVAPRRADDMCTVRITKTGHGQVHDGNDGRYDWNDEVVLPVSVGRALEGRSFGEIVG